MMTMDGAVRLLLELLAEERMKRFALNDLLEEEKRLRLQAENKTLELREATIHAPPQPIDVHMGSERIPRVRVKRAERVIRTIPLDESLEKSPTGRDC